MAVSLERVAVSILFLCHIRCLTGTTWAPGALAEPSCAESKALGMQSRAIPDSALSASSSYSEQRGPQNARIRLDLGQGGWCPAGEVFNDTAEWLQIDLDLVKVITAVETQGLFNGTLMAHEYRLEYMGQVNPSATWQRYQDRDGKEEIKGNTDADVAVKRKLDPPIRAQRLRILPQDTKPTYVCMRVELYGCLEQEPSTISPTEASTEQSTDTTEHSTHTTEEITTVSSEEPTEQPTDVYTSSAEQTTAFDNSTSRPGELTTNLPAGGGRRFRYFPDLVYVFLVIFLAAFVAIAIVWVRRRRLQRPDMELDSTSENAALIA